MPVLDLPPVHEIEESEESTLLRIREYVLNHPDAMEVQRLKNDVRSRLEEIRADCNPSCEWPYGDANCDEDE
jgi:hypothetical protein